MTWRKFITAKGGKMTHGIQAFNYFVRQVSSKRIELFASHPERQKYLVDPVDPV
jgi:hypothetical protein